MQTLCDSFFALFAFTFAYSRLYVFPAYVLYSFFVDTDMYPLLAILLLMLSALQVLHIFWFSTIAKMVYKALVTGKVEKDDRSESE